MTKSFKRQQKIINKYVRHFNKILHDDEAFLGRIYLRQYSAGWHPWDDGSGGLWYGVIRIYDKETNTYKSVIGDFHSIQNIIFRETNDFIVNDLQIDIQRALALKVDYRDVKHNPMKAQPFYDHYEKNYSYKQYSNL